MKHIKHSRFSPVNATETLEVTVRVLVKKKKKNLIYLFSLFLVSCGWVVIARKTLKLKR